jgi:heptose I phosphotransferase
VQLTLNAEIKNALPKTNVSPFDYLMQIEGTVYRELENRRTQRIVINDQGYFIKQHFGVGWREIFKNLFQGRLPIISAENEVRAIQRLHQLDIPTQEIAGFGYRGLNPAHKQSFLITKELINFITLEDLTKPWKNSPPAFSFKFLLIQEVARHARNLHRAGINHRDFYICHFLLDLLEYRKQSIKLYLIDLHRAQIRQRTPTRWLIKDLAGLYFSSKDIGLTQRDLLRFIKIYRDLPLREILNKETTFWWKVKNRGDKLYRKHATPSV